MEKHEDQVQYGTIKLSSRPTREFWEIPVLYEDTDLLALNKPSGLPASPDRVDPTRPNLIKLMHMAIVEKKPWTAERNLAYLMNAHRPDPDASGVILFAKSKPVLIQLANLFGSPKMERKYRALVKGEPDTDHLESDAPLRVHLGHNAITHVDSRGGKKAQTVFEVRERYDGWTLLECRPLTERPHQIRAHLRALGFPVVGDTLYGGKPLWLSRLKSDFRLKPEKTERPLISSLALHAEELMFSHPASGTSLSIKAGLPKDFTVGLKYLRRYALKSSASEGLADEAEDQNPDIDPDA